MNDFKAPEMSKELTAAITKIESLDTEKKRVEGVLETERERLRAQEVGFEETRSILSARESEQALSGGAPDPKLRRSYVDARDEIEMVAARVEGVSARLAIVDRDLDAARAQLADAFELWRSAEIAKSADRLSIAMKSLIDEVVIAYASAAATNDKRMLTAIRGLTLFDPAAPTSKVLFQGSSLRAGRFRSDTNARQLYDDTVAVRLRVSALLANTEQAEAVDIAIEEETTR